jgi:N utilization substance protein A
VIRETVDLFSVIDELVVERGLDKGTLSEIVCEGMLAAYQRKYPDYQFKVDYDQKTGQMHVLIEKVVVTPVEDEDTQISLKKARNINSKIEAGQTLWVPFEGPIGRIEILRARQVIASKIRKVESDAVYNEFKDKENTIVLGVIHKCERGGVVIKLGDTLAFLPKSNLAPGDKCAVGFSIRTLLKEVLPEPHNDYQVILDRVSERFLQELFEIEIPEVFEKLVEIKKIVRAPGYKSKVIVISNDKNIDPVGTCVGVGGSRIKPILRELSGEKIDIISLRDSREEQVADALKPAVINRVEIVGDKTAHVWLDEDQRSLAIGKGGQNISLAARLTDMNIQLMQSDPKKEELDKDDVEEESELE